MVNISARRTGSVGLSPSQERRGIMYDVEVCQRESRLHILREFALGLLAVSTSSGSGW